MRNESILVSNGIFAAVYMAVAFSSLRLFATLNASASPVWPPTGGRDRCTSDLGSAALARNIHWSLCRQFSDFRSHHVHSHRGGKYLGGLHGLLARCTFRSWSARV